MNQQVLDSLKDVVADRPGVTLLRLVYKKLGPIEAQWIADAMRKNTHVTLVRLDSNRLGDRGTSTLCQALKGNCSVTELNLATNEIYCDGICAAADLLRSNKSITSLKLNHNYIGLRGANAVADMLKVNKTLQQLNVSCKSLPAEGVVAIAKALAKNQSLISVHFTGAQVGNKGAAAIADALKDNCTLRLLNLSDCGIENDGAVSIFNALKANLKKTSIKSIDLTHNKIADATVERISGLLEQVQSSRAQKPKEPEPAPAATFASAMTTRNLLRNMFGLAPGPPKAAVVAAPPEQRPCPQPEQRPYTQPHSNVPSALFEFRRPQVSPLLLPALSSAGSSSSSGSSSASSRSSVQRESFESLDDTFDVAAAITSKFHSPRGLLGNLRGFTYDSRSASSSAASSPSTTPRLPPVVSPRAQPSTPAVTSPRGALGPIVSPRASHSVVLRERNNVLISPRPVPPLKRMPSGDERDPVTAAAPRPVTVALTEASLRRRPSFEAIAHPRPLRKNSKRLSASSLGNCSSDGEDRRTPASLEDLVVWDDNGSVDEHEVYSDEEGRYYEPTES
eukprot:TRINITY_DN1209_c0_g1_i2.p1 TRINITY_DN1209_c0_g1~~TRINITY_DN1209_c0_g1_i2.p1  ORF type:complete len:591 (+),score=105.69 TRINITY_DN1209_c0_g1_i2:84-1775(+)